MIELFASERQTQILSIINNKGSVKTKDLELRFKASKMTILRDLRALEEKGLIERVHGGAIKKEVKTPQEPSFKEKSSIASKEKEAIAKFAAQNYVEDGDIISLGAGTTILKMIPYLKQKNLTILTNGLQNMVYGSKYLDDLNLIGSGGSIRQPALIFVGPIAENFFSQYKADTTFLSGTGLTIKEGIMDPHPLDVEVKRAMCNSAKKKIFLIDSSKINKRSLASTIKLKEIDILITDKKAPANIFHQIRDLGVELVIV
ncbi:MAG: DeoR/GlpR family DNA-binding transcription regulator [Promethearchaeota archaeon]